MVQWLMFHFVLYVYTVLRFLKYYISVYFTGAEHNGSESWCSVTFFIPLPFLECFLLAFLLLLLLLLFFFVLFCFLRIVLRFGTQFHPQFVWETKLR